jgi:hypothetical protein
MFRSRMTFVVIALMLAATGCDSPSDPLDGRGELAALLQAPAAGTSLSLPALVYASVRTVYTEQGATAARALVAELRRAQHEARMAANGSAAERGAALVRGAHEEELRIVLRVLGGPVIGHVLHAVRTDAAELAARMDVVRSSGRPVRRAEQLMAQLESLLAEAVVAEQDGAALAALDAATRAAAAADAVRHALAEAQRVHGLEDLFADAAAAVRAGHGAAGADAILRRHDELARAAAATVSTGDRVRAHDALSQVRQEQISLVIETFGAGVVRRMLVEVADAAGEATAALAAERRAGRDVSRLQRMVETARDMQGRAAAALVAGDVAGALDLGSHAAGLIDAAGLALRGG